MKSSEIPFEKGGSAAFLVMSPFQLLCALEAINTFEINNFYIEFVLVKEFEHRNEQMIQMASHMNLAYSISFTDEIDIETLYNHDDSIPLKASCLYERVFIGDYNSKHLHVEAFRLAEKGGYILYLDDGTSTICLLNGVFNDGDTNSWISKYNAFKYKRGTNKLHRFIQNKMKEKSIYLYDAFYTMYDKIPHTKYQLFPNNFDRLRSTKQNITLNENLVCIIGTAIHEFSESVLRENEEVLESIVWIKICKIKRMYSSCKIIYIPHPRDTNTIIPKFCSLLDVEYIKLNESVESYLLNSNCNIKAIWGFGSTALGVLRKLFESTEIVNISISKGSTTKIYDIIYKYYSLINIKQEVVNLAADKTQNNLLVNIYKNAKELVIFISSKILKRIK